jgi:hypothetical protein
VGRAPVSWLTWLGEALAPSHRLRVALLGGPGRAGLPARLIQHSWQQVVVQGAQLQELAMQRQGCINSIEIN